MSTNINNVLFKLNNELIWAPINVIEAINALIDCRKGGCASVHEYIPTTNYVVSPVQNIQFLSRVSTSRLYERRIAALEGLTFGDVADRLDRSNPKLADLSDAELADLFNQRRAMEIASMQKSLDGVRDDAHRQGHDRCYRHIGTGIKVHLVTEKGEDGLMHPVLTDGYPTVKSIMLSALFLTVKTIKEGERKVVNSGAPVLMSNAIKSVLTSPGLNLRTLSLKSDNFTSLSVDHRTLETDPDLREALGDDVISEVIKVAV